MTPYRVLVLMAAAALPAHRRERYREQWLADLRDCAECQVSPRDVAAGALRFALTTNPLEGHSMKPIGPLALAMRHAGSTSRQAILVAVVLTMALLVGIGLLLT